jgi:hypothetical protein
VIAIVDVHKGIRKNTESPAVRIGGVTSEIQTQHLLNTNPEHYLQIDLLRE